MEELTLSKTKESKASCIYSQLFTCKAVHCGFISKGRFSTSGSEVSVEDIWNKKPELWCKNWVLHHNMLPLIKDSKHMNFSVVPTWSFLTLLTHQIYLYSFFFLNIKLNLKHWFWLCGRDSLCIAWRTELTGCIRILDKVLEVVYKYPCIRELVLQKRNGQI